MDRFAQGRQNWKVSFRPMHAEPYATGTGMPSRRPQKACRAPESQLRPTFVLPLNMGALFFHSFAQGFQGFSVPAWLHARTRRPLQRWGGSPVPIHAREKDKLSEAERLRSRSGQPAHRSILCARVPHASLCFASQLADAQQMRMRLWPEGCVCWMLSQGPPTSWNFM